jgi:hypothetical protein
VCLLPYSGGEHALIIRVTWRVSYKMQELLPLHVYLGSPAVSGGIRVAHYFSLLYCIVCFVFYDLWFLITPLVSTSLIFSIDPPIIQGSLVKFGIVI